MIKVKIELWPGGRPAGMKSLGEMNIANIKELGGGMYDYDIVLHDYPSMEVKHSKVTHNRTNSVWYLLFDALEALDMDDELPEKANFADAQKPSKK